MDNSPGWAGFSYNVPVYWPWTRRVGISLVQLTLILGLIKCSFCDNTDMVILIRWFYHPKFCFEYFNFMLNTVVLYDGRFVFNPLILSFQYW
ncbi:hypothetical protein DERF_009859 [Dermatophagoides farinae]|uniref:Uncharacterized protein n=1 Tax=Dermatophagoides farinae TaxID=6954 RepID=A0A922HYU5_DERFA|nr:hypothetical protein DERF_009859 [Dermatophagoides farinae]